MAGFIDQGFSERVVILVDRVPPSLLLSTTAYASATQLAASPAGSGLVVTPIKPIGLSGASSSQSKRFITLSDDDDIALDTPTRHEQPVQLGNGIYISIFRYFKIYVNIL